MTQLVVSTTIVLVLVLGIAMVTMIVIGLVGILSGKRLIVGCPQCGRWEVDAAGVGPHLCMHCAHPGRFSWEPALLHDHRVRQR
jgi:Zinc-ribbon containing domain